MAIGNTAWTDFIRALDYPLFKFGGAEMTAGSISGLIIALLLLLVFSRWLRNWLVGRAFARSHIDIGTRETFATLIRYIVLAVGFTVILQAAGISLSSLTVIVGALGVGVGLSLQNIFSNFASGLIVMFERPVKIGDHILVAGAEGDVIEIGARATTLLTAQNTKVVVPNQSLIIGNVVNWDVETGTSSSVISLHLAGDLQTNEQLVLDALLSVPQVVKSPAPRMFLSGIDHAGHTLEIHFWLAGNAAERLQATNLVNRAILKTLASHEVALIG